MKRNGTFENYPEQEQSPAEPHFEDERTLLSARPVVLLTDLDKQVKKRRRLSLIGAFAFSVLLGAGVAFLSGYLGRVIIDRTPSDTLASDPQPGAVEGVSQTARATVAVAEPSQTGDRLSAPESILAIETREPNSATIRDKGRSKLAVRSKRNVELAGAVSADTEQIDQGGWQSDTKQEIRARRVFRHSQRRKGSLKSSDLFRIREIFEGSPPQ